MSSLWGPPTIRDKQRFQKRSHGKIVPPSASVRRRGNYCGRDNGRVLVAGVVVIVGFVFCMSAKPVCAECENLSAQNVKMNSSPCHCFWLLGEPFCFRRVEIATNVVPPYHCLAPPYRCSAENSSPSSLPRHLGELFCLPQRFKIISRPLGQGKNLRKTEVSGDQTI